LVVGLGTVEGEDRELVLVLVLAGVLLAAVALSSAVREVVEGDDHP